MSSVRLRNDCRATVFTALGAQRSRPHRQYSVLGCALAAPLVPLFTCSAFGNSSVRMTSSSRSDVVSNFLACEFSPDSSDVIDETIDANTDAA